MKTNPVTETKTTPTNSLRFSTQPKSEVAIQVSLKQQTKNLEQGNTNIALIHSCIGVIRSKWYNKSHQLMTFCYGTAFQVSPRIIITGTHNVFSKLRSTWAHEVEFAPGVQQGMIQEYYKNVRGSLGFQGKLQMETYKVRYVYSLFDLEKELMLKDCVSFENSPQNYDASLVVLQERANQQKEGLEERSGEKQELCQNDDKKSIEGKWSRHVEKQNIKEKYISLRKYSLTEPLPLTIIGYPSQRYRTCMRFDKAYVQRSQLRGLPYLSKTQEKDNVIHYCIPTSVGMSGSPILVCDGNTYSAVGIHTHRGQEPGYNSGIYFNEEMIKRIKELEAKIERNEKIPCSIDYQRQINWQIKQGDEKQENEEDTPSPKKYHWEEYSSKVNSLMDEQALPQQKELSEDELQNMSKMFGQSYKIPKASKISQISQISKTSKISKVSKQSLMSQTPNEPSNEPEMSQMSCMPKQSPHQSSQSSDQSNTSEMSQLDDIYEFLTVHLGQSTHSQL